MLKRVYYFSLILVSLVIFDLFMVGCSSQEFTSEFTSDEQSFFEVAGKGEPLFGQAVSDCKIYSVSNCISDKTSAKFIYQYKGVSKKYVLTNRCLDTQTLKENVCFKDGTKLKICNNGCVKGICSRNYLNKEASSISTSTGLSPRSSSSDSTGNSESCNNDETCGPGENILNCLDDCSNGLIGYWNFDSGNRSTTKVFDLSGNGHDGIINELTFTKGIRGQAANFDGEKSYLEILNPLDLREQPYTYIGWMKPSNLKNEFNIIMRKMTLPYLAIRYNKLLASDCLSKLNEVDCSTTSKYGITEIEPNQWYHVAMTWAPGSPLRIYLNGQLEGETNEIYNYNSYRNTSIFLGASNKVLPHFFKGLIDEFKIYKRQLSAEAIQKDFLLYVNPVCGNNICETGENTFSCSNDCIDRSDQHLILETDKIAVWDADMETKIYPYHQKPAASACKVTIKLAKNEIRSRQIAITPRTAGTISNIAIINNNPELDINFYLEEFVDITRPIAKHYQGLTPDPLIKTTSLSLEPGQTRTLLIEAGADKNIPAGIYEAVLLLDNKEIPLQIEIYDFSLPDEVTLKTAFDSGHFTSRYSGRCTGKSVADFHGINQADSLDITKLIRAYYSDYAKNKISPYRPQKLNDYTYDCETDTFDFTNFDRELEYYLDDLQMNSFEIGSPTMTKKYGFLLCSLNVNDAGYNDFMVSYYQRLMDHLVAKGWEDKAYFMIDEPNNETMMSDSIRFADIITSQVTPTPRIGPATNVDFINNYELSELEPFNNWIIYTGSRGYYESAFSDFIATGKAKDFSAEGDDIWWYHFQGNWYAIDVPAIDNMIWFWMGWKYNVTGFLHWAGLIYDYHCNTDNVQANGQYSTPWNSTHTVFGNGQMNIYYPPCRDGACTTPNYEVVPSLRIKLFREGIEDYEYFTILRKMIIKAKSQCRDTATEEAVLARVDELVLSPSTWVRDGSLIREIREEVARAIAGFSN